MTGAGEYAPMPPVLGPRSPSKARLWSCAETSGSAVSPSHSAKKRRLLAVEELLDDELRAGRAQAAAEDHVDRRLRLGDRRRDDDALAGGEPVRLDHDGRAARAHIGLRRRGLGEALIGRGRDGVRAAEILGEALGALEPRRRLARAERLDARRFEIVDDAGHQRRFRPDDHQIDRLRLAERDDGGVIGVIERDAFRFLRDAGIAGRAVKAVDQRACGHLPGERVLASTGAEKQDVHGCAIAQMTVTSMARLGSVTQASSRAFTARFGYTFVCPGAGRSDRPGGRKAGRSRFKFGKSGEPVVVIVPVLSWLAALIAAAIAVMRGPRPIGWRFAADRLLRYLMLFPVGLMGLWAALGHLAFPAEAAQAIGWADKSVSVRGRGGQSRRRPRRPLCRIPLLRGAVCDRARGRRISLRRRHRAYRRHYPRRQFRSGECGADPVHRFSHADRPVRASRGDPRAACGRI